MNDVPEEKKGKEEKDNNGKDEKARSIHRQQFLIFILSVVVVSIILTISYRLGDELFYTGTETADTTAAFTGDSLAAGTGSVEGSDSAGVAAAVGKTVEATGDRRKYLYPYVINLAGVLLFVMNTSRKKRERWKLSKFWGDHFFRIAQSFAYLFFILWAWPISSNNVVTAFPPIILGFLVGLYIIRVERAMEALGEKFGETLLTVLPRSTQFISMEEKRRKQMRMVYKVDDIKTQYEVLRGQVDDPGARDRIDMMLREAEEAMDGEDPEKLKESIDKLTWTFDEVKKSAGEVLVPIEDVLGERTGKED